MDVSSTSAAEKFGSVLGYAPGNVPAFSSDYDSADDRELPDRHAYRSYIDGIYMGYKWQCVEFARRWMYVNKGYIFDDVAMAYDIFDLTSVRVVRDNSHLPLKAFRNGSLRHPQRGALMVWDEGGEFERTGHVAVVVEVSAEWVRVAEQNVGHKRWTAGAAFAREIKAKVAPTGEFWVECSFGDATILNGVNGLSWTADGDIVDHLGVPIRWVWKTWAWETALDQIRLECEDDALQAGASWSSGQPPAAAPRLADVLLSPQVMVFEPLWTLIPSNKAILPVLWQLFPNHPYLLETAFELTTSLQETGYVVKPIVGRCGSNITIVDGSETIREETAGNFGHRDRIYQQFCPLPELDGRYVQICSFSVDGSYAASCVRLDRAMVINDASEVLALRVLPDSDYAMSGGI